MKICPNCGAEMNDTSRFCKECGYRFEEKKTEPTEAPKPKKKKGHKVIWILLILAGLAAACYFTSFHKTAAVWLRRVKPVSADEKGAELFNQERLLMIEEGDFERNSKGEFVFKLNGKTINDFLTADLDADGKAEMLVSSTDGAAISHLDIYQQNNGEMVLANSYEVKTKTTHFLSEHTKFYDNGVICISQSDTEAQYIGTKKKLDSSVLKKEFEGDVYSLAYRRVEGKNKLINYSDPKLPEKEVDSSEYETLKKDLLHANELSVQAYEWTPENLGYEIKSQVLLDSWLGDHGITISKLPGDYQVPVNCYGQRDDFWGRYYLKGFLKMAKENNQDGTKTLRFSADFKDYPYTGIFMTYSVFDRYTGVSFECDFDDQAEDTTHSCNVSFPLDDKTIDVTATYHDFHLEENTSPTLMEVTVPKDYEGTVFMIGVEFDPVEVNTEDIDFSKGLLHMDEWASPDGRYLYFTESNK